MSDGTQAQMGIAERADGFGRPPAVLGQARATKTAARRARLEAAERELVEHARRDAAARSAY